jgi:hypothetical protein
MGWSGVGNTWEGKEEAAMTTRGHIKGYLNYKYFIFCLPQIAIELGDIA